MSKLWVYSEVNGVNLMLKAEQKQKIVEQGLEQFCINPKFRDCLKWIIDELDKVYEKKLKSV